MAMAKMAGDADSEGGRDEGARAASSVHLAAEGRGGESRRKELDEVGSRGAKKGRCAARNAPTKWTAGNEIYFFCRRRRLFLERLILQNGSNGSDTNCGILPELHMGRLPGGPS